MIAVITNTGVIPKRIENVIVARLAAMHSQCTSSARQDSITRYSAVFHFRINRSSSNVGSRFFHDFTQIFLYSFRSNFRSRKRIDSGWMSSRATLSIMPPITSRTVK